MVAARIMAIAEKAAMLKPCASCGHVRDELDSWPDWQCPACLLAYETSNKLARRNESVARSVAVRIRHKKQRRQFLLLVLFFIGLQTASGWLGGWFLPQLWLPALGAMLLAWLPIGFFGLRKPAAFWLPVWCILSGLAIGTTFSHFKFTDGIVALSVAVSIMTLVILMWLISGKTPKRSGRVHRQSGGAAAFAFIVCIPLVVYVPIHPAAALMATMIVALTAGWMQFRIYRATRHHGIREAWPLTSVTMLDWLTPKAWKALAQDSKELPESIRSNDGRAYSGSEKFGRRGFFDKQDQSQSAGEPAPHADLFAAPGTSNAIDSRSDRLRQREKPIAPDQEGSYTATRPLRYRQAASDKPSEALRSAGNA